jgi:hypothetical protein
VSYLYIRLFGNYWSHRKTVRLKSILGNDALWIMPRIWSYASESEPEGDFSEYTAEDISTIIGYSGDAKAMLQALHDVGFMDTQNRIHDWNEHNGFHAENSKRAKRAANERWKKRDNSKEKCSSNAQAMLKQCTSNANTINNNKIKVKTSTTFAPSDGSPPAILVFLNTGEEYPITVNQLEELQKTFPAVDVQSELQRYRMWTIANPKKRKTKHGVLKSVSSWMRTEQDRGGKTFTQPRQKLGAYITTRPEVSNVTPG